VRYRTVRGKRKREEGQDFKTYYCHFETMSELSSKRAKQNGNPSMNTEDCLKLYEDIMEGQIEVGNHIIEQLRNDLFVHGKHLRP